MNLRFIKDMEDYQYILKHKKSAFTSVFRNRIIEFTKEFDEPEYYESELIAFPFFEDYYYAIIKDLIKNNIKSVIDIGCQVGLQSELFIKTGIHYTGVDYSTVRFFNDDCTNVDFKFDNFISTPEFIEELKLSMNFVYKLHNVSLDIEKDKDLSISDGYVYIFEKK